MALDVRPRQFASDNYSGVCPVAMDSLAKANFGHDLPYGEDRWTAEACDAFRELFETDCDVYFVFNGTGANSLALASLVRPYNGIICHELGHIETDECGAPEFYTNGAKILLGHGEHGKLSAESIEFLATRRTDIHYPKPKAVSVTQATEVGTVYFPDELRRIHDVAEKHGMLMHMDGARFANAAAFLGLSPKELTWKCGIDVLCFGGTKNGLAGGEAVVFFNKEASFEFAYRCKQSGQLASKMRFIAAPWVGLLKSGAWLSNARRANEMAARLAAALSGIQGVEPMFPVQANSLFLKLQPEAAEALRGLGWKFYTFIGSGGARFMCSWDTDESDVDAIAAAIRSLVDAGR